MNILYYCTPVFKLSAGDACYLFNYLANDIASEKGEYEFRSLVEYDESILQNIPDELKHIRFYSLTEDEKNLFLLKNISKNEVRKKFHFNEFSKAEKEIFNTIVKNKMSGWEPDIIIGVNTVDQILRDLYPNALCLGFGAGIFRLPPFPPTAFWDPVGYIRFCSLCKFCDEIKGFKISDEENLQVEQFKKDFIQLIQENNPLKSKIEEIRKKYTHLILFPLNVPDPMGCVETPFSPYVLERFMYYMDKIPSDVGVLLTEHPCYHFITPEIENLITTKYPNLIYLKGNTDNKNKNDSLYFLPYVDAVVQSMSMLGPQTLLFDAKIISIVPDGSAYNDYIKDADGFSDLKNMLIKPKRNKNNVIFWLLTRFYLFKDKFFHNERFFNLFVRRYEAFKKSGITFEWFDQIMPFEEAANFILCEMKKNYNPQQLIQQLETHEKDRMVDCKNAAKITREENVMEDNRVNEIINKYNEEWSYFKYKRYSVFLSLFWFMKSKREHYKRKKDEMKKIRQDYNHLSYAEKVFGRNIDSDKDKDLIEKTYKQALAQRDREISLYWQRTAYFIIFIGATLTMYQKLDNDSIFLTGASFLSFLWYLSTLGAKYWQKNWEIHVQKLEKLSGSSVFSTYLVKPKWFDFLGYGRFSVSRINSLIALFCFISLLWKAEGISIKAGEIFLSFCLLSFLARSYSSRKGENK